MSTHDRKLSPMEFVRPAKWSRVLGAVIAVAMAVVALALYVTPWQQSAPGAGRVIAFAPDERQQNLEAPIEGRVLRWYVTEGAVVKAGEPIVELSDNDPDVVQRLRSERDAVAARLDAARMRAIAMESRVDALENSRVSGLMAADARVTMASQRVAGAEQGLAAADAALNTAALNVERQTGLRDKGLTSQRQMELTELESLRATTELERARATLVAAKSELSALESDKRKLGNDATAAISDALGARQSAEAEVANSSAELSRIEVRLARQSAQVIVAPKDGVLFRVIANGHLGEVVKAGDLLATLVPDTKDRAVEIWVSGNDLPLIRKDNEARIQFEGWPALQFSGWPSIAVGTFPARVLLVDAADDGSGKFRVLLAPPEGGAWPEPTYLRQGARAQGWILLGEVRLGYELWRQFNSFPPSLPSEPKSTPAPASDAIAKKVKGGA